MNNMCFFLNINEIGHTLETKNKLKIIILFLKNLTGSGSATTNEKCFEIMCHTLIIKKFFYFC